MGKIRSQRHPRVARYMKYHLPTAIYVPVQERSLEQFAGCEAGVACLKFLSALELTND